MQKIRNFYAKDTELSYNKKRTYPLVNAKEAVHRSFKSGTFIKAMQQNRNIFRQKCKRTGTFNKGRNKTGTFKTTQAGKNPTPKPYITNNVPLLLQKHS
ncbi:MAG: hypothetical protein IJ456_01275 [Bacteroides sp.]|nr:hypothetical protein [Bacteroides sp.]